MGINTIFPNPPLQSQLPRFTRSPLFGRETITANFREASRKIQKHRDGKNISYFETCQPRHLWRKSSSSGSLYKKSATTIIDKQQSATPISKKTTIINNNTNNNSNSTTTVKSHVCSNAKKVYEQISKQC